MSDYWKKYVWNTRPVQYPLNVARSYVQPHWNTKFTATQITNKIWLSDFASACNKEELEKRGIKNVVTVIYGMGEQHSKGIDYLILPVIDDASVDISQYFAEAVEFIDKSVKKDESILIHCAAGRSRSVTIIAAYLIKYAGMEADEAFQYLKDKRKICKPNPGFVQQAKQYAEMVMAERKKHASILEITDKCPMCGMYNGVYTDGLYIWNPPMKFQHCIGCKFSWYVKYNFTKSTSIPHVASNDNLLDNI